MNDGKGFNGVFQPSKRTYTGTRSDETEIPAGQLGIQNAKDVFDRLAGKEEGGIDKRSLPQGELGLIREFNPDDFRFRKIVGLNSFGRFF